MSSTVLKHQIGTCLRWPLAILVAFLLSACATEVGKLKDPDRPDIIASQAYQGHFDKVSLDYWKANLCNGCEARMNQGYFINTFRRVLDNYEIPRIRNVFSNGKALNRSANNPLDLFATVKDFKVELGFGYCKIYLLVLYELKDKKKNLVASWMIPSYGVDTAMATQDNTYDGMVNAVDNNVMNFYLRFISESSPQDAEKASSQLDALGTMMKKNMAGSGNAAFFVAGHVATGLVHGAQAVGNALDNAGRSYARYCENNADECAQNRSDVGFESSLKMMDRANAQALDSANRINAQNQRYNEAVQIRRDTEAKAQAEQRSYQQELARSNATPIAISSSSSSSRPASSAGAMPTVSQAAKEAELAKLKSDEDAAKRIAQEETAKRRADEEAAERKAAEETAKRKAEEEYFAFLRQNIKLKALTCMGGEGAYFVTGSMPKVKEVVSCIDVHYRASCPGSGSSSTGILGTFGTTSGCLGDLSELTPKPSCPINQVTAEVVRVTGCNSGKW